VGHKRGHVVVNILVISSRAGPTRY
jgi:hypothetical protein